MNENDIAIPFEEDKVKKYLDDMIDFWREVKNELPVRKSDEYTVDDDIVAAECYIDAYQSVRKNLFGELKK